MLWVGTSFKMTKTLAESVAFAERVRDAVGSGEVTLTGLQTFIIPSFTAIANVAQVLKASKVLVGAQDAHWEDFGPWTGSVSLPQLTDVGATVVEIGHSERRQHSGETDETVRLKVKAALEHGFAPIVCVGEPHEVFASGDSVRFILRQIRAFLEGLSADEAQKVVIAYEPIWAIGQQGRAATPDEVASIFQAIHDAVPDYRALIYGGSVNVTNAHALLQVPHLDGIFPGRGAWDPDNYLELVRMCAVRATAA